MIYEMRDDYRLGLLQISYENSFSNHIHFAETMSKRFLHNLARMPLIRFKNIWNRLLQITYIKAHTYIKQR